MLELNLILYSSVDDVGNFSYGPGMYRLMKYTHRVHRWNHFVNPFLLNSHLTRRPLHETKTNANGPQHGRQLWPVQAHGCSGKSLRQSHIIIGIAFLTK